MQKWIEISGLKWKVLVTFEMNIFPHEKFQFEREKQA